MATSRFGSIFYDDSGVAITDAVVVDLYQGLVKKYTLAKRSGTTDLGYRHAVVVQGEYDVYFDSVKDTEISPLWIGAVEVTDHYDGHGTGTGYAIAGADIVDRDVTTKKLQQYHVKKVTVTGTPAYPQTISYSSLTTVQGDAVKTTFTVAPKVDVIPHLQDRGAYLTEDPGTTSFKVAKSVAGEGETVYVDLIITGA